MKIWKNFEKLNIIIYGFPSVDGIGVFYSLEPHNGWLWKPSSLILDTAAVAESLFVCVLRDCHTLCSQSFLQCFHTLFVFCPSEAQKYKNKKGKLCESTRMHPQHVKMSIQTQRSKRKRADYKYTEAQNENAQTHVSICHTYSHRPHTLTAAHWFHMEFKRPSEVAVATRQTRDKLSTEPSCPPEAPFGPSVWSVPPGSTCIPNVAHLCPCNAPQPHLKSLLYSSTSTPPHCFQFISQSPASFSVMSPVTGRCFRESRNTNGGIIHEGVCACAEHWQHNGTERPVTPAARWSAAWLSKQQENDTHRFTVGSLMEEICQGKWNKVILIIDWQRITV